MFHAVGALIAGAIWTVSSLGILPLAGNDASGGLPQTSPPSPEFAGVRIYPAAVAAGSSVRITAFCPNSQSATARSDAFGSVNLSPASSGSGLVADATIRRDAQPGTFIVAVECQDGTKIQETLSVYAVPTGGPPTGGGGLASNDRSTPLLVSGIALAAAGVGVLAVIRRRSRPSPK